MAPLLQELSSLEVTTLEIVENAPAPEQDSNLDTLTAVLGDLDVTALLTGNGVFTNVDASCCCCCCPVCCCC